MDFEISSDSSRKVLNNLIANFYLTHFCFTRIQINKDYIIG